MVGIIAGVLIFLSIKLLNPLVFRGKEERIGMVGKFYTTSLPVSIQQFISGGLTRIDDAGFAQPLLASSWEVSDDGKSWTFHIKDGIKWQDGKEIVSGDLKYNLPDVTVSTPDSKTIVFNLKSSYSPLPNTLSKPIFKKGLLGFGQWVVSKKVILFGGYVQKMTLTDSGNDKKTYIFYPTEERAKLGLKLGQVDKIMGIYNPSPIDKWKTLNVEKSFNKDEVAAVFFNTSASNKLLSEKNVRQALSYAIDKDSLNPLRAISPISPLSWAYNPQVKPYNYDLNKAREIVESLPKELKQDLQVRLVTTPVLLNQAEKIAKDWDKIGIKTILQVTSVIPSDFDAYLAIFDIPKDPDQYAIWHSSQISTNVSRYSNPRIDKLLEDGRTELDQEARKKIYLDFQRFLVEDSPAIFLYHPISYTIERK